MKTITGTFQKADGSAVASGKLYLRLSQDATAVATAQIAPQRLGFALDANGTLGAGVQVLGNDELMPAGTTYTLEVRDVNDVLMFGPEPVSITGTSPINLNLSVLASPGATPGVLLLTVTSITVTGTTTLSGPIVATGTDSGVQTITGAKTLSGPNVITAKTLNGIRFADQFPGADLGAQINAASADAGANATIFIATTGVSSKTISTPLVLAAGTHLKFDAGFFHWTGAQTISNPGITIEGAGRKATVFYIDSATSNLFDVTGENFHLLHLYIGAGTPRTGGSIINASGGGTIGVVQDIYTVDVFRFITMTGPAGGWRLNNIRAASSGGNWDYFAKTYAAAGTTAGFELSDSAIALAGATQTSPALIFDSRTDTVELSNVEIITASGQPAIRCQDTDVVGGFPRWIHAVNTFVEAGGGIGVDLLAVRDFKYVGGYIASAQNAVHLSSLAFDVVFDSNVISDITQTGIVADALSAHWRFANNTFSDIGSQTNDTYDIFSVGASSINFAIVGNSARVLGGNAHHLGVTIAAGASSNFAVENNHFTGGNAAILSNGATGGNYSIRNNPTIIDTVVGPGVAIKAPAGSDYTVSVAVPSTFAYKFGMGNRDVRFDTAGTGLVKFSNGAGGDTGNISPATGKGTFNGGVQANRLQTPVSALPGTTGTVSLDASLSSMFTVTPTGAITLNATNCVDGQHITVVVTTSGVSSFNITFNTNFKSTGVLATGTTGGKVFTITFVCTGTTANETARTVAM